MLRGSSSPEPFVGEGARPSAGELRPARHPSLIASQRGGSRPRILVVEADERLRCVVAAVLNSDELDVVETASGAVALALAQTWRPDVVVLDVELPDADGVAVCRSLRENPRTSAVGIVLMSHPFRDVDLPQSALQLADIYLAKRFRIRDVQTAVHQLLRRGGS
jgi:DNA-binding response OmpR family regulator